MFTLDLSKNAIFEGFKNFQDFLQEMRAEEMTFDDATWFWGKIFDEMNQSSWNWIFLIARLSSSWQCHVDFYTEPYGTYNNRAVLL